MIELRYSDDLDRLVESLTDVLSARWRDAPLSRPVVVVPNPRIASYLKLSIARRRGIVANLDVQFLDRFLIDALPQSRADRVLSRDQLTWLVFRVLSDSDVLAAPQLADVNSYITFIGSERERDARRFQLAVTLSRLFTEYGLFDPDLPGRWTDRMSNHHDGDDSQPAARWQRTLWRAICDLREGTPPGMGDVDASPPLTLIEHYQAASAKELSPPPRAALFGFSHVSKGQFRMLGKVASCCQLAVYQVNPCRQFWEDTTDEQTTNPLLASWGRIGQLATRELNELANFDFEGDFTDRERPPTTALDRVQNDILEHRSPSATTATAGERDRSIEVLACPTPRRELEAVAHSMWKLVRTDGAIRWNDIALVLCGRQAELYRAHVSAVFGEAHGIPHHHASLPLGSDSRAPDAATALLSLPAGDLLRPDVLEILTHPLVRSRYPGVDPEQWIDFCDQLGILRGADAAALEHTYIVDDRYNWDQGLVRLALGACMADGRRPVHIAGRDRAPLAVPQSEQSSAAQFIALCRSLIADAQFTANARLPLHAWAQLLDRWLETYLHPRDSRDADDIRRCRDAVRSLDALVPTDIARAEPVGFAVAREFAARALSSLHTASRDLFAHGICVAKLGSLGPIPFRAIYAVGLAEGDFPEPALKVSFDLRPGWGAPDSRKKSHYDLLELVLAARQKLVLSYTDRDQKTGESRAPAGALAELLDATKRSSTALDPVVKVPVHAFHHGDADSPERPAAVARRARAVTVRRSLERHCQQHDIANPSPREICDALRKPGLEAVAALTGLASAGTAADDPLDRMPREIRLEALRRFLDNPLEGWAGAVIGLRGSDRVDAASAYLEPFEYNNLQRVVALGNALATAARSGVTDSSVLHAAYNQQADDLERRSLAPTGPFALAARKDALARLTRWWQQLQSMGDLTGSRIVGVGSARERTDLDELLPAIELDVAGTAVQLTGQTELVAPAPIGVIVTCNKKRASHVLRGLLSHVLLAAADELGGEPVHISVLQADRYERLRFTPPSADQAREYLARVATALYTRPHDYLFNAELALIHASKATPFAELRTKLRAEPSEWAAVRDIGGLDVHPDPDKLYADIYAPMLSRLQVIK